MKNYKRRNNQKNLRFETRNLKKGRLKREEKERTKKWRTERVKETRQNFFNGGRKSKNKRHNEKQTWYDKVGIQNRGK